MYYIEKCKFKDFSIILVSDGEYLTNLFIDSQGDSFLRENEIKYRNLEVFDKAKEWLNDYFSGIVPKGKVPISVRGSSFRQLVWKELLGIPYGKVKTYGEIAKSVAKKLGKEKMSAQAVGNAIHNNPVSIIIPCHRVIGKSGDLVGYAGGVYIKKKLLEIEGVKVKD